MILVTGAGGKTGLALIKALSKVESVRAFVHQEAQVESAEKAGSTEVLVGDFDHADEVQLATRGVRAIYHICPNMSPDEIQIGKSMIASARANGVEHFVYHSVLHPQIEAMSHHWNKLRVEEKIFACGLPFTILQPAPYMQNWLAGQQSIVGEGVLRIPYSVERGFSFVDLDDIAEAARIVLTEPGHACAVYELAGTWPLSHAEVAQIFSRELGLPIRAEAEEIKVWESRAGSVNNYAAENLVSMFAYYDRWGLAGNPNVLGWILRRPPTSVEAFASRSFANHPASA